jgi:Tfp pilus assembly protein PilX
MNQKITKRMSDERGLALLAVILIIFAASVLGMAGVSLVAGDLRISGNYRDSSLAFWAAEAGLQQAIATLAADTAFTGTVATTALTNQTTNSATIAAFGPLTVRAVATGTKGVATRQLEAVVNIDSVYAAAINVGGNLTLAGKPRISSQGVRVNGSSNFNLDPGTPNINLYTPSTSTVTVTGNNAVTNIPTPPMDLGAVALSAQQWVSLSQQAAPNWYFSSGVFGSQADSQTFNNLNFANVTPGPSGSPTIFVDGNVMLTGSLSGTGTIVATGSITGENGFVTNGSTVSFVAKGDILLNFDTNAQSSMNGLVFTEGNYELHGKMQFTGVVMAFGSVDVEAPSQFTNNSDPNFWYTYSSAYATIADPVHVLSWAEDV